MTPDELVALGKVCLVEYEPKLKVLGVEPYHENATLARRSFKGLEYKDENQVRVEIYSVLDTLAALPDGFRMSEPKPDPFLKSLYKVDTVRQGQLNLSFVTMYDSSNMERTTHVSCWYYPG